MGKPGGGGVPAGGGGTSAAMPKKLTIKRLITKYLFGDKFMSVKVNKKNY